MPDGTGCRRTVKTLIAVRAAKCNSSVVAGRGGLETISARKTFVKYAGPCQLGLCAGRDDPRPADRLRCPRRQKEVASAPTG